METLQELKGTVAPKLAVQPLPCEGLTVSEEFHPEGLEASYFDKGFNATLPVFAVINTANSEGCKIEIETGIENLTAADGLLPWRAKERQEVQVNSYPGEWLAKNCRLHTDQTRKLEAIRVLRWLGLGLGAAAWLIMTSGAIEAPKSSIGSVVSVAVFALVAAIMLILGVAVLTELSFWNWKGQTFHFNLPGVLPTDVREQIRKAQSQYQNVYLVCEAKDAWTSDGPRPSKNLDPMIIGEQGGKFVYLGMFDLTPREQFLRDEFCTKI